MAVKIKVPDAVMVKRCWNDDVAVVEVLGG